MDKIEIRTAPHETQRYNTAGDYFIAPGGVTFFRISDMGNPDYNFMIAVHELVEAYLCNKRGIPFSAIDKFDIDHPELDDPGSSKKAPYHTEHMFALKIEKMIAKEMGINWEAYENRLAKVCK